MKRSLFQVYVKDSKNAVLFYQNAFESPLGLHYRNEDGTFMHAELSIHGHILAVSEADSSAQTVTGNTMQCCFHFEEEEESFVRKAYDVLKNGAEVIHPLGPCSYSSLMTDLIDKYGIRWCLFV